MEVLESWLGDAWVRGTGDGQTLFNPATGEPVAKASSEGLDLGAALAHLRDVGGPALRALTFAERGERLQAMADAVHDCRKELLELSTLNTGTTRRDAKFDVDGAAATLGAYAAFGRELGDARHLLDGPGLPLGRSPRFHGQHIQVARRGAAVHINAFNFPAWGTAEKLACSFLAGMPALTKPATLTALPAARMARAMVESGAFPVGTWAFLCGSAGDLLDHLRGQDVVAFTGSADTAARLRVHPGIVRHGVPFNVEADSLNAVVVAPDVSPNSETWRLFMHELVREMTQKSGQKCTATRRVMLPEALVEPVLAELKERLSEVVVGDPADDATTMGSLATLPERTAMASGAARLAEVCDLAIGSLPDADGPHALVEPLVFVARDPDFADAVHDVEVFGPSLTLLPYDGTTARAGALVARGQGGLVATAYSDDLDWTREILFELAPYSGRVLLGSKRIAEHSTGPGLVLPALHHGGPGRAGGGSELGGRRGLALYMQTVAVQGPRPVVERILSDAVAWA